MDVIVPACGLSTRFPGERPKYLLYTYDSQLMIKKAVQPYIDAGYYITIGVLREHQEKFDASHHILAAIGSRCTVVFFDERTRGPADTVYQILKRPMIHPILGPFLVKDCDSFFTHNTGPGNYVCVSNIKEHETLNKLASKSFVKYNDQGTILDIVEKEIVSDTFCVGGYKFNSPGEYCGAYEYLARQCGGETYVSHVIHHLMKSYGTTFNIMPVQNYVDVGTQADWMKYNNKPTIFFDIDGCLIKAQSRFGDYNYDTEPVVLKENYNLIKRHYDNGSQVIFVTAREPQYEAATKKMLESLGFHECLVIMGVNNASRLLVNDYNEANPYPRSIAYNIKRNHDNLKDFME